MNGVAPWGTGWSHFQSFIVAAALPDGQALYGMVPLETIRQESGGKLLCSEPMALAAMSATGTVTVAFKQWFLPASQVVCVNPAAALIQSDRHNVLNHSFLALGCADAALDILNHAAQTKPLPFIATDYAALTQELDTCRQAIFAVPTDAFEVNLALRVWAIALMVRCAQSGVAAWSGAATDSQHPAQRVYREALTFTVASQTTDVMAATLEQLVHT